MRILILCTGEFLPQSNGRRFPQALCPIGEIYSAGTVPAVEVHPKAVAVIREIGIDLSAHKPKLVDQYLDHAFHYGVIVVAGGPSSKVQAYVDWSNRSNVAAWIKRFAGVLVILGGIYSLYSS
jgi:arsenate reductase